MTPLFQKSLPDGKANLYGLILEASNIPYRFERDQEGWVILVPADSHPLAFAQITAYTGENMPPVHDEAATPLFKTYSGIYAALVLAFFYLSTGPFSGDRDLIVDKGALANAILDGEVWRTITALCIHADILHLLGNMAFLAIFSTGVCQIMGYGVGWLLILCTGSLGNLGAAAFHHSNHLAGGASTAVFGALGLLGGMRAIQHGGGWGLTSRRWLGLAAGLALLAFLGNGPTADIVAHLTGWLAGIALGAAYALLMKRPVPKDRQLPFLTLAAAILLWAWAASGF